MCRSRNSGEGPLGSGSKAGDRGSKMAKVEERAEESWLTTGRQKG